MNSEKGSLSQLAVEAVVEELAKGVAGPLAGSTIAITSKLGKKVVSYLVSDDISPEILDSSARDSRGFVVIGLGRCGSRVTAQLASMIAAARGPEEEPSDSLKQRAAIMISQMRSLFNRNGQTLRLEPTMVIGDLNEATFTEIRGIMGHDNHKTRMAEQMLKIDYRPLAPNGAGNIPIFGEFFTRGLLALPPSDLSVDPEAQWKRARTFLLDRCSRSETNTRLAFYIFSAAGGSGAGAAAELMRAQRFAVMVSTKKPSPQLYFTGVAVIPEEDSKNDAHIRNAGRTLLQYLADLNIQVEAIDDYHKEPTFRYSTEIISSKADLRAARVLQPWDSLGIVSNAVMRVGSSAVKDRAQAEALANQYIAQQVFNLAAAQSQPEEFKSAEDVVLSQGGHSNVRFQALHLDKEDLRAGLRGPLCFAFAAASEDEVSKIGHDAMFLRAVSLPGIAAENRHPGSVELVEGISVSPQRPDRYTEKLSRLWDGLKASVAETGKGNTLTQHDLSELSSVALFKRCPRVVFVLTSPLNNPVTLEMSTRIANLVSWLMPNLKQARFAVVPGTTPFFTLSLYIDSSVVLCYEVERAIMRYVWECWQTRGKTAEEFQEEYYLILDRKQPISDEVIENWIGPVEQYGSNVPDWISLMDMHNSRWQSFVNNSTAEEDRKGALREHRVEHCFVSSKEVAAALRYINYMAHYEKKTAPEPRER